MQIALPELQVPATLIPDRENPLSEGAYLDFCETNPDLRLERTAQGEIIIVPPAGLESDHRNADVVCDLIIWARKTGRGKAFGPTSEFLLPDGAALSPDAAWVSNERLISIPKAELRKFPHVVPEFVVEVMSPSDRLPAAKQKMAEWMANGVELAWLIDGDVQRVYVFRQGCEMRVLKGVDQIAGEGPLEGFILDLNEIWRGLKS